MKNKTSFAAGNTAGKKNDEDRADAVLTVRTKKADKNLWVAAAKPGKLSAWVIDTLNRQAEIEMTKPEVKEIDPWHARATYYDDLSGKIVVRDFVVNGLKGHVFESLDDGTRRQVCENLNLSGATLYLEEGNSLLQLIKKELKERLKCDS